MNGYQSKSRDAVWKQVSSIYSTIAAENLQYVEPPASFGTDGQKIRTPDRIVQARVATCLDLAMLFASCLEQAGLRPGHPAQGRPRLGRRLAAPGLLCRRAAR